jgi:hypothetical protein
MKSMANYQFPNMFNPYMQPQTYQRQQGYTGQIIQVNGKAGAEALQMEPNSSVYVQDSTQGNRIFLCMTDGAGYKTVRGILGVFEEEKKQQEQTDTLTSIDERLKRVEERLNEFAGSGTGTQDGTVKKHDADDARSI